MAQFIYEVTDDQLAVAIEAYAYVYNYQEKIADEKGELIDNPVTKSEFMLLKIQETTLNHIKSYTINKALRDAKTKVEEEAAKLNFTINAK